MASSAKFPVGEGGRLQAHTTGAVELPDLPLKPPPAPKRIGRDRAVRWRRKWSLPVAALWNVDLDGEAVLRLIDLELKRERDGPNAPAWIYSSLSQLEQLLYLTPRSRRAGGIMIVPAESSADDGELIPADVLEELRRRGVQA